MKGVLLVLWAVLIQAFKVLSWRDPILCFGTHLSNSLTVKRIPKFPSNWLTLICRPLSRNWAPPGRRANPSFTNWARWVCLAIHRLKSIQIDILCSLTGQGGSYSLSVMQFPDIEKHTNWYSLFSRWSLTIVWWRSDGFKRTFQAMSFGPRKPALLLLRFICTLLFSLLAQFHLGYIVEFPQWTHHIESPRELWQPFRR